MLKQFQAQVCDKKKHYVWCCEDGKPYSELGLISSENQNSRLESSNEKPHSELELSSEKPNSELGLVSSGRKNSELESISSENSGADFVSSKISAYYCCKK